MARKNNQGGDAEKPGSGAPQLDIHLEPGETVQQKAARIAVAGTASNAYLTMVFGLSSGMVTNDEFGAIHKELKTAIERTKAGGTEQADEMLTAQAVALNQVFMEMGRRAALNMNQYPEATDTYLRLALKAQSQCRQTLESLAEIRNPRHVAFVKQANIAGGHQQINNGGPVTAADLTDDALAHVVAQGETPRGEIENQPNELSGEFANVTRLDTSAKSPASRGDHKVATVGAIDRPAQRRRQGGRVA